MDHNQQGQLGWRELLIIDRLKAEAQEAIRSLSN